MESAIRFQHSGYMQQAEELYRKILREQPNNVRACFALGSIQRAKGRLDEAITYYRRALELKRWSLTRTPTFAETGRSGGAYRFKLHIFSKIYKRAGFIVWV